MQRFDSRNVGVLNQTAPSLLFSGPGPALPPASLPAGVPVAQSGLQLPPSIHAVRSLDAQLGQLAAKIAPLLAPNLPAATRASATAAAALLNAVRQGYVQQLQDAPPAAAWNRPHVRLALQKWRVALDLVNDSVQSMHAALTGAPAPAAAQAEGVAVHWPGDMRGATGIWSWNPNLWGKTQEEANAYLVQQAQANVQLEQAAAAAEQANPSTLDKITGAVGDLTKSASAATSALLWVGVAGAAALAWWTFKDPERGTRATGQLAAGGAHAAGTFVEHGAKAAAGAAKLAVL